MAASKIYDSYVIDKIRRTEEVLSLRFKKPSGFTYEAGQFMYITYKTSQGDKRKHLTISSSPTEPFLEITKRLTGSDFSNGLLETENGDWIRLEGPYGDFVAEPNIKKIAMLCGGIGITPLRSMIKFYADKGLNNDTILIYSNEKSDSIAFKDELDEIVEIDEFNFSVHYTITQHDETWTGEKGRINDAMLIKLIPDYKDRTFFTSGPPGMVDAMRKLLNQIGVGKEYINFEYFPGYMLHPEINLKNTE